MQLVLSMVTLSGISHYFTMVTLHSDDVGAKFSFFLDSLIVNKGFWSVIHLSWKVCIPAAQQNSSDSHKVRWMPAREDMIGLKEAEGKWEFLSRKLMGTEEWDSGICRMWWNCPRAYYRHGCLTWWVSSSIGTCSRTGAVFQWCGGFRGFRRLLNFFGRITHLLTQGVTHLEASDILWNLSAKALMPQQFPSRLRNPCCVLVWCKFHLSAEFMRAEFRV